MPHAVASQLPRLSRLRRAHRRLFVSLALILTTLASVATAQPLVVETEPLTPEEQRQRFHLPPGFEIQLVASEPLIGQPMNLSFDAAGRLWATSSIEYPYPAAGEHVENREERFGAPADHPPQDWVMVFEGIDAQGKPARSWRFAQGLNIPIGVSPDPRGNGALVYSIPALQQWTDVNSDGAADESSPRYGPFGNVDTHGMVNSLTRGLDGWIYACHGFRNTSRVAGIDGHAIEMNSGNTFRFRADGSRIEQHTWGQVNPFGMAFDPWGNLYSADCHSRPLTCLLRGAYYQSFGKPHDGLGFGPDMIDHNHGSTGICGVAWYDAEQFPETFRDHIFLCNPVTGRVHCDRIEWRGSSPWVDSQPDFITCDDGWFRPVDVKLGPDGALYIADFYNAIIGHYEVPLDHPRRDRTHGRIWRVVYRGEGAEDAKSPALNGPEDMTLLSLDELLQRLSSRNMTVRHLATELLLKKFGAEEVATGAKRLIDDPHSSVEQRVHAVWLLFRADALTAEIAQRLAADDAPLVRTHLLRALGEMPQWEEPIALIAAAATDDEDPQVRRAAVEALGKHPAKENVARSTVLREFPASLASRRDDTHLRHVVRMALRNHLQTPGVVEELRAQIERDPEAWTGIALAVRDAVGAGVLLDLLQSHPGLPRRDDVIQHVARYGDEPQLDRLLAGLSSDPTCEPAQQLNDLHAVQRGLAERGGEPPERLSEWGKTLAADLLAAEEPPAYEWTPVPYGPSARSDSAFAVQARPTAAGNGPQPFHSSLPRGEQATGRLQSEMFELPPTLTFYLAGHNGFPAAPETPRNVVRLHLAETGEVVRETLPPRNDLAQRIEWDLTDWAGHQGYFEIQDGDDREAYAWLAAGKFSIEALNPQPFSPRAAACEVIASLRLEDQKPQLAALLQQEDAGWKVKGAAAEALLALEPDARLAAMTPHMTRSGIDPALRQTIAMAVHSREDEAIRSALAHVLRQISGDGQLQLALVLAREQRGAATLLDLVEQGAASPRLLQNPALLDLLRTHAGSDFEARAARLTENLSPPDEQLAQLLWQRRREFFESRGAHDLERGKALFKQHCAACHRIGEEGEKIGPQLDGVGVRGADRLLEDILDPNRNVDAAFRTTIVVLDSGEVLTGLVRREEGETLVLADQKGKEFRVALGDIETRKDSQLSLMPANVGETLPAEDLSHLLRFLLESRERVGAGAGK